MNEALSAGCRKFLNTYDFVKLWWENEELIAFTQDGYSFVVTGVRDGTREAFYSLEQYLLLTRCSPFDFSIDENECTCSCHFNVVMSHEVACCDGPCPKCKKNIKYDASEAHQRICATIEFKDKHHWVRR